MKKEKMRVFKHPSLINEFVCPICKTGKDLPVVLVGIPGTEKDGNIECKQVHYECYKLFCKMHDIELEVEK